MNIKKRASFLACLWVLSMAPAAHSIENAPRHMVFASDPQYPWTEKSDSGEEQSASDRDKRSQGLIESQFANIADFRGRYAGQGPVPLMINGDMTAFGHISERSYIRTALNKYFGKDFLYGLGNHDYKNNVGDCFSESCAAGSIVDYKEHHWGKVDNFDLRVSGGGLVNNKYNGSLAYSTTVGDVHMVQLNNEPTYEVEISHFLNPTSFRITQALDWLETDLRLARAQGYIIIVNMHEPDRWGNPQQVERFNRIINQYGVTAVFAGHYHSDAGSFRSSWYYGKVPVFLSGGASQQTYLIASFSEDRKVLHINRVENNDWSSRNTIETVPVKSVWSGIQ
ncbi:metallophosphoesterase family protein [Pseudomonas sp. RT4P38]